MNRRRAVSRIASLCLAASTAIAVPCTVRAADDVTPDSLETSASSAQSLPQVVVAPSPTPIAAAPPTTVTVHVNTTVTGPVTRPYEITWSVRVRPLEPVNPPRALSDDDPVLQGLAAHPHRPRELYEADDGGSSAPPRESSRASRALLYTGLGVFSAANVLASIPFFVHGRGGLALLPVAGAFAQAATWGSEGIATSDPGLGLVSSLELASGIVQLAGAVAAIGGAASTCRTARRLTGASAVALVPGPVGSGAGAVFSGRW